MSQFKIINTKELLEMLNNYTYKQLHVHHTWKPDHRSFNGSNHIKLQENMKNYHVKINGWSDIGQHVTLMPDGKWVTGRSFNRTPASIKGWNTGAFAVEMLGNFNVGNDELEGVQKKSIIDLSRYFVSRFGEGCIKFHREGPNVKKTCPGTSITKESFMKGVLTLGSNFKDVDDNRWSAKYINAAKELGIIKGESDGNFNPTKALSREEAAVLMVRIYEKITGKKVI